MLRYDLIPIVAGLAFYASTKFLCALLNVFGLMYKKHHLSSIPERNEMEEDVKATKWVSKKKHEVLKAKYKCLKKLFQIYDASVIGILPESNDQAEGYCQQEEPAKQSRRKKRYKTKIDACAGTTEASVGDVSVASEEKDSIASAVIRDLKLQSSCSTQLSAERPVKCQCSCPTQILTEKTVNPSESTITKPPSIPVPYEALDLINTQDQMPHFYVERKQTRFQTFLQRLFGVRRQKSKSYMVSNGHVYAASDDAITQNMFERRRRRGPRFRRLRRPKKIHSELALNELKSPIILSYVQSVQRNCLLDRTPRQCPCVGCKMIFYGIINYNDHLNLSHFPERKFICHYCHEGFEEEYSKLVHENEHLGITKLNQQKELSAIVLRQSQKAGNTQTEPDLSKRGVQEEKLKKIVSFFDKLVDTEQILTELKKQRYSESNLQTRREPAASEADTATSSDKRTVSCGNLGRRRLFKSNTLTQSDLTSRSGAPVKCHICGEEFDYRRQLSLHVDLEHRVHDQFSKFHSTVGMLDYRRRQSDMVKAKAGKINIQSVNDLRVTNTSTTLTPDICSEISRQKSEETLSCDPSTNIIYYESLESVQKPALNHLASSRNGFTSYHWEPGTKIIRV